MKALQRDLFLRVLEAGSQDFLCFGPVRSRKRKRKKKEEEEDEKKKKKWR